MKEIVQAKEPFNFNTRLHLTELTGLRASTLEQLLILIKEVPGSCIYHHTHRFLQQHISLSPEPPNDFAYWVIEALGEHELGERLASIDVIQFSTIRALRERIEAVIEAFLSANPSAAVKSAGKNEEFYFMKSVSFILTTKYSAHDLEEFADILGLISIDSIYFHMFESRLRLGKPTNDFSCWIEASFGDKKMADEISGLDPYTYAMEDLRRTIIKIIRKRISS